MPVVRTAVKNTPSKRASLLSTARYLVSSSITYSSLRHPPGLDRRKSDISMFRSLPGRGREIQVQFAARPPSLAA